MDSRGFMSAAQWSKNHHVQRPTTTKHQHRTSIVLNHNFHKNESRSSVTANESTNRERSQTSRLPTGKEGTTNVWVVEDPNIASHTLSSLEHPNQIYKTIFKD